MIALTTLAGLVGFMALRPAGRAFAFAGALLVAASVPVVAWA